MPFSQRRRAACSVDNNTCMLQCLNNKGHLRRGPATTGASGRNTSRDKCYVTRLCETNVAPIVADSALQTLPNIVFKPYCQCINQCQCVFCQLCTFVGRSLPTFTTIDMQWSRTLGRWMTSSEKLTALGFPAVPEIAKAYGVESRL